MPSEEWSDMFSDSTIQLHLRRASPESVTDNQIDSNQVQTSGDET